MRVLALVTLLTLSCLLPACGAAVKVTAPAVGRYQLVMDGTERLMVETASGRVWSFARDSHTWVEVKARRPWDS